MTKAEQFVLAYMDAVNRLASTPKVNLTLKKISDVFNELTIKADEVKRELEEKEEGTS
jgi:hypothetical protein